MDNLTDTRQLISSSNGTKKSKIFYGYVILIAGFLVLVIMYGAQFSFGVFFKPVLSEFGWTREMTSGAYSMAVILQGISGFIAGKLSDKYGPRSVITVCGLLSGSGYLLMSQVNAVWQIYLFYGVMIGIGGASWVPILSSVVRWFFKRRGLMSGIAASGIGVGTIFMPLLANNLISRYSWRISFLSFGLLALIVIVTEAQFLRRAPGQVEQSTSNNNKVDKAESKNLEGQGLTFMEGIRTRQFLIISIVFFVMYMSMQVVMVHIVPHVTDMGISAISAATILSVIGGVSAVGRVGMGNTVDRIGNKPIMIIVAILMFIAFIWLLFAGKLWMLYVFAVIFALSYGGMATVMSPLIAEHFGLRAHGAIFGLINFAALVGGAIGALVAGRIFDVSGSYQPVFVICASISFAVIILASILKPGRKYISI